MNGTRPKQFFGLLLLILGGAILVFGVARAIYYPFWAAGASDAELARSWGGPSPIGATAAHWLVAAILGAVGVFAIRAGNRWRSPSR